MPSAEVLADQGVKAVSEGKYAEGVEKLTEALKERPAPLWLLERSKAHLRTDEFDLALYDATKALHVALARANRDHMIEAQIRRAVTYFRMGRFADADICAFWAIRLLEKAKATEDDGQLAKVDANGDYDVTLDQVVSRQQAETKQGGLMAAMADGGRTKETRQKNTASSWRMQALTQLQNLPPGHAGRKVGIEAKYPTPAAEPPSKKAPSATATAAQGETASKPSQINTPTKPAETSATSSGDSWEAVWSQYQQLHTKQGIRSSYYQSNTNLNIDFFVKNVSKDDLQVDVQPRSVTLGPIPGTFSGNIHLSLFDEVVPSETKYTVKSMKIELVLQKQSPGKWPSLQKSQSAVADNAALGSAATFDQFRALLSEAGYHQPADLDLISGDEKAWYLGLNQKLRQAVESNKGSDSAPRPSVAPTSKPVQPAAASNPQKASSAPAYPTSSKKGPMNWDSIQDDEEEKKDQDVNSFFQSIYKNADEDTKRAMMKSYVESNGTSLSTNWSEAKEKTYETLPPDGSEAKKW